MLSGIILAVIAGAFVSLQTIFNNKVNEQVHGPQLHLCWERDFWPPCSPVFFLQGKIHLRYSICSHGTGLAE